MRKGSRGRKIAVAYFFGAGLLIQAGGSRACVAGRPGINRGDPLQVGRRLFMPEARPLDGRRAVATPRPPWPRYFLEGLGKGAGAGVRAFFMGGRPFGGTGDSVWRGRLRKP